MAFITNPVYMTKRGGTRAVNAIELGAPWTITQIDQTNPPIPGFHPDTGKWHFSAPQPLPGNPNVLTSNLKYDGYHLLDDQPGTITLEFHVNCGGTSASLTVVLS
jgi:hypothetical protein